MHNYDIALLGLGPNNLAIAYNFIQKKPDLHFTIIDQQYDFAWHAGYPKGYLQISSAKASVTKDLSDPLHLENYVKKKYCLAKNEILATKLPHDFYRSYLDTVYKNLIDRSENLSLHFGKSVRRIEPDMEGYYRIDWEDGHHSETAFNSRMISLGLGVPARPACHKEIAISAFQQTISDNAALKDHSAALNFQIRGGGQSAADAVCVLIDSYPHSSVDWIVRAGFPRSCDANPFVNDRYTYSGAMDFYFGNQDEKKAVLAYMQGTDKGVVSSHALDKIYSAFQAGRVRVLKAPDNKKDCAARFSANGCVDPETAMADILPEGWQPLQLEADFRIAGQNVYVPGGFTRTHGVTAGTICDLGKRARLVAGRMIRTIQSAKRPCDRVGIYDGKPLASQSSANSLF